MFVVVVKNTRSTTTARILVPDIAQLSAAKKNIVLKVDTVLVFRNGNE